MTITISPFVLGVLTTIFCEILAFFLLVIYYTIKETLRKRRNASNLTRNEENDKRY